MCAGSYDEEHTCVHHQHHIVTTYAVEHKRESKVPRAKIVSLLMHPVPIERDRRTTYSIRMGYYRYIKKISV